MPVRALILILIATVAVSGCGRRGSLEEPRSAGAVSADGAVPAGAGVSPLDPGSNPPGAAPATTATPQQQPAPRRRFFLDFLL
jgi:hypothetical protein